MTPFTDLLSNIDWLSAIVALIAMAISIIFSVRSTRSSENIEKIESFNAHQAYRTEIISWGRECLDAMSESIVLCKFDPARNPDKFYARLFENRSLYYSLIDHGRWFLKNTGPQEYDQWEESAYRGLAPEAIEHLMSAQSIAKTINFKELADNGDRIAEIVTFKRKFTACIQDIVDPETVQTQLQRMTA
jgi:hypothetical protein